MKKAIPSPKRIISDVSNAVSDVCTSCGGAEGEAAFGDTCVGRFCVAATGASDFLGLDFVFLDAGLGLLTALVFAALDVAAFAAGLRVAGLAVLVDVLLPGDAADFAVVLRGALGLAAADLRTVAFFLVAGAGSLDVLCEEGLLSSAIFAVLTGGVLGETT